MTERRFVDVYPQPEWVTTISCDGKPCGGKKGCGTSSTAGGYCKSEACGDTSECSFARMMSHFAEKYGDEVEVRIADYSSLQSIQQSLENLNQVLEDNAEELRLSLENIGLVFSQIAPIVAVDNILEYVGKAPTEQELVDKLGIAPR